MSCTVFAIPYALAWVVAGVTSAVLEYNNNSIEESIGSDIVADIDLKSETVCEDVHVITDKHFIDKVFETPFTDNKLLKKTLEEHGVIGIEEDALGNITGIVEKYNLRFEKKGDKPYVMTISCVENYDVEETLNNINSEYALNVQEDVYMNITQKLKQNNLEIESEEVMEDNTIVLTVNLN